MTDVAQRQPAAEAPAAVASERHAPVERTGRRTVYVWELPVRICHWTIVLAIVVLSITGYWLHHPFFGPPATAGAGSPGFTLGLMRFLHELAAFAFICAFLFRSYWAFVGNRYAHWRGLLPLTARQRSRLRHTVAYYAYRREDPPTAIGHNPLAGLAYVSLWCGFALSIGTGLALFGEIIGRGPWTTLFGWQIDVLGIQGVRLVHFMLMWWFIAFAVHHVYSAALIDREERNGELSSIVTGWKLDYGGEDDF